ncbi:DUF885 domain-containing protein [Sphingomonas prati]|uniref:Uncharacterized protein (DUF885 family) n=1 Tax=Sphingomonas prati TaxID=1843237 RepID=A0A7W9F151_9SPHN|nr:DUF885 domain-containing protein [Sphingomonas prati]MBB5728881.1 uncharacterized protein (DUF885 family) [Sphingomonas prati]
MRFVTMLLAGTIAAALPASATPAQTPAATPAAGAQDAALASFFDAVDKAQLARSPQGKAYRGIRDADYGKLDDPSDAARLRDYQADEAALADMKRRFDPARLSPESRLSYDLFVQQADRRRAAWAYRDNGYVFDQMNGVQSRLPAFLINIHRITNRADADAYVSRLRAIGPVMDSAIATAARRAQAGVQPPKWVYPYVISDARNVITGAPFGPGPDAPLSADLKTKVNALAIPAADKAAILKSGADAMIQVVKPAYDRLIAAMTAQEKTAGTDDGIWRFKDGAGYYAERLKNYTTTEMTPDQIHQVGLDNVARIHREIQGIMTQVGFKGSLQDFFQLMRTDKRFYAPNTPEGRALYLSETEKARAAVTAKLPQWFGVLPKAPLVVKAVEPFREKSAGKAFYQSPAPDGSRPGTYYANLYDMADMPLFEVEALFYHEGIPGHHLQRAIQTELTELPPFRRYGGFTAYTEGWGLYSEKLAKDMGLYTDPYRDFGRLQLELHRAIRLVVDSGLHHKRWTREKAIQYVKDNSADAPGGIVKAIERYIVYPGQATAYLVGRLKISELRDRAQAQLGSKYDVRAFHDVVLKSGPLPLDILERRVDAWIATTKAS